MIMNLSSYIIFNFVFSRLWFTLILFRTHPSKTTSENGCKIPHCRFCHILSN